MAPERGTARILVVDDEPDLEPLVLQKFRKPIREGELTFTFARNGEEALTKLRADPAIDIVLSDINMPVMDGLTLLTEVKQLDRLVRTVMVSAYDDLQNIRTAMNRGAYDFLTKPIDFRDFETTLRKTIREVETVRESMNNRTQLVALQNEIAVASRIQQSILPRTFPSERGCEIYAEMLPARIVSGDFYDFFNLDERRVAFAVADVSGKGVPAAIFMAVCRTLLRAIAPSEENPKKCLRLLNHALKKQSEGEMFVTMFYGVLDRKIGTVEFAIAGQTPPYWISGRQGTQAIRDVKGNMLGLFDEPEIGEGALQLDPGDLIFSVTDGVPDTESAAGVAFSTKRLGAVLASSGIQSARETVASVLKAVQEFGHGAAQTDDITALAIRFIGP